MDKNVSIGLLGLGVVGSGVIKLVKDYQDDLKHQLGCGVNVKTALVRDIEKARKVDINGTVLTTNPDDVIKNPDIQVIVEVMGGVEGARKFILQALENKKHVITANKDLIALHGPELEAAAGENGCDLFYEASVGGGIPLLRGLTEGLVSDRIQQVMGIVNGTTNYILTKMDSEGATYEDSLAEAQELGFAESDPTADVDGLDSARKMVILSRLAFLTDVELDDVEVSGISDISQADLQYGKKLGYTMKLIGFANHHQENVEVSVRPTFLANHHPLVGVKNEYNAVYINGESVGETMFYGPGAGGLPTATAVMSDVVEAIKNMKLGVNGKQFVKPKFIKKITPAAERYSKYYVRLHVKDEVGAFAVISELFNQMEISFERIFQTPSSQDKLAEIVLITHKTSLADFETALEKLENLEVVDAIKSYYCVEGDA